ncbi:hypothetical protein MSAN_00678200 [Mycena sanguinolenta]|uniref:Spore coat protein U domain-containing protein n=1 Tax=Mycena sanguinolenta TaxID=230812 RepID=A0A8H7DCI9_9AGAR|nr:hypothetical protein MSAN_00678200 [Mycena sanguinolenta]
MHFNKSKFLSIAAVLASVPTTVMAQAGFCPEALRYGSVSISPSTVSPGQTFTVTANLTCAIQLDNTPTFLDYYIDATATHTVSGPILIARRTYDNSTSPPIDQFTATLPNWYYYTDATYTFVMDNSFARPGPTGESVITVGGTEAGITITGI